MKSTAAIAAWVLSLTAMSLFAADAPAPAASPDETIVLPTLEVSGKFSAEGWVYTRIDRTEFLSQLSAKQTHELADDFVVFQEFVRAKYPEAALPADFPVTVVLCNDTATFRQFGGTEDRVTATLPESERFIIIDANQINQLDKTIRWKWTGLAFRHHPPGTYPLWREAATREILANVLIRDGHLEIGYPRFFPGGVGVAGFNQFNMTGLLPLSLMFTLTRDSPEYREKDGMLAYHHATQSTAFMHLCLFGTRYRQFREPFQKFIKRLETEPVSEALFRDCFGVDYLGMSSLLRDYAIGGKGMKYETLSFKFPPTPFFEVRPAQPAEVLRFLKECRRRLAAATEKSR